MATMAAILAIAVLYQFQPKGQIFYPKCGFHADTGLWCPGCGGTRAIHDLLHGNLGSALRNNALLVLGVPSAFVVWGWFRLRGRPFRLSSGWVWFGFAVFVIFGLARNLPWMPMRLLAPLP